MMTAVEIATVWPVKVSPAVGATDWLAAGQLTGELVDWLKAELRLDAPNQQKNASQELEDMAKFYGLPDGLFLLGRLEGRPAGTTGIRLLDSETAEIKRVWVTPTARGNGLAPRMLERALDAARLLGARRVRLETEPNAMATAVAMYSRAGFKPIPHYTNLVEYVPTLLSMEKQVA